MSSILVASRGGVGPSLWRSVNWEWRYADAEVDYSAASVQIVVDPVSVSGGTRAELTDADSGVTTGDGYIDCAQAGDWVSDNLPAGSWRAYLIADGSLLAFWTFDVVTPAGGEIAV